MTQQPPAPTLGVWIGFIGMAFGNFMAVLDIQIVASSMNSIQAGISASRDEISWVQTAYLIAEVIGIPLSGFLGRALGTRVLFCLSSLGFAASSLLCAMAWNLPSLIMFRAMQGFSGAAMIPTTMSAIYLLFPQTSQPIAAAILGLTTTIASSVGPTLGGWVSEALGWRALFWINLAPGLLITFAIWRYLRVGKSEPSLLKRIDLYGLVGMALFLGSAEYVLEQGPSNEWFASGEIWLWTIISAIGGCLFFWRVATVDAPIVDLRPFRTPAFSLGSMLGVVLGVVMFGTIFLTPLYLTSVRGYSSLQVGHTMFVQGAVMLVLGPIMGQIMRSTRDTRPIGAAGFALVALASWLQGSLTADAGLETLALPQALRGVGLMFAFSSIMQPAMRDLPPQFVHAGSGLFSTMRNLGGAFGIALLSTLQQQGFAMHKQELYAAVDPANPHVQAMIAGSAERLAQSGAPDPSRQALMYYASMLDREALVMTFNSEFQLLAIANLLAAIAVLFLGRPRAVAVTIAPAAQSEAPA